MAAAKEIKRRRYGPKHKRMRVIWAEIVARGFTPCARCGELIRGDEPWHLDHTDDGSGYLGPSHVRCNCATYGRRRLTSRDW